MQDESDVGHENSFAIRWRNFRSFDDTRWITLRRLTLLLGANSAGKSSLIAPLLLLKQSTYSRTGTNALLTRGEYLDVGVYQDFVRNHDMNSEVSFSIRWHSHARKARLRAPGSYAPGGLAITFGKGDDVQSIVLKSYRVEDTYRRAMLTRILQSSGNYSTRMVAAPPARDRVKRAARGDAARRKAMRETMAAARPEDFIFRSREVRMAGREARAAGDRPTFSTTIDDDRSRLYCAITDHAEWGVRAILESLHYIGPLREPPRRVYELSGEMPAEVGTRGEFAPEIIYRWRSDRKRIRQLRKWLTHFGFSEQLEFKAVGTGGFSLVLTREGAPSASSFVDTGFGMSQVLPLIVQGMLAEKGDTLLIEQPEIHLNPKLQAAIADLLVDIAKRDVGLLIESHSEHLLLRLRRLLAEGRIDDDVVGLYFVEQEAGVSRVREVNVSADGFIDPKTWPKGFFADALQESMALAQAQARQRRRRQRANARQQGEPTEGTER